MLSTIYNFKAIKKFSIYSFSAIIFTNVPVLAQENSGAGKTALEEIIVTGLKREGQNIVSVSTAIAVIDGLDIENTGADQIEDFLQFAPGVSIDEGIGVAGGGTTSIQVRGVSATFGAASVGFYLDDLPFSFINFNLLPDPSPFDLKSVEVLKGPQGTLYGAGSSAGVVLINTNDPVLDTFGGKLDVQSSSTKNGGGSYSLSGAINAPLIEDKLALRAAVSYQNNGGFIDDFTTGQEDINGEERLNIRAKLLFVPSEELEIKLIAAASQTDNDIANDTADDNLNIDIFAFPTPGFPQGSESDYEQFGAVVKYEAPLFTVRNAFSYLDFDNSTTDPLPTFAFAQTFDIESYVNELRFNSNTNDPFSWVGGFFYRKTDQVFVQDLDEFAAFAGIPATFDVNDVTTSDQFSIFGEVTYAFGQFEISAGLAYVDDDTESLSDLSPITTFPLIEPSTSEVLPQASFSYHPSESSTIYFRYAQGLRVSIPNFGLSSSLSEPILGSGGVVGHEESESFELGAKGHFFGRQLYAEAAIFTIDIENLQQSASFPFNDANLNTVLNINGLAKSRGVEWLLDYSSSKLEGLSLTFSGSYVNAEIQDEESFNGALIFAAGTPLNLTPEVILAGRASYTWAWTNSWDATLSGSIQYTDGRPLTVISQPSLFGDDLVRADVRFEVGKGDYSFYAFANNLTDEDGVVTPDNEQGLRTSAGATFVGQLGTRYRPRTFGLGVRANF